MTDKLTRPTLYSDGAKADEYRDHCRNIARIISYADVNHEIEARIQQYLAAVGV